jgi:isorenieratene synthase
MKAFSQPHFGHTRLDAPLRVAVLGGGLAGIAAAVTLAERGAAVTLLEPNLGLGGRLSAWPVEVAGERFEMDRGFHAFFRHYYNLRALLRRVDPALDGLTPLTDYPILTPAGPLSFADLPANALLTLLPLMRQVGLGIGDLRRVRIGYALAMLGWHPERTPARWDALSAEDWLRGLNFPPAARMRLLDVFAHSFFNPTAEFSAADLLMLFHYYFFGNREGLVFDVARRPFGTWLWRPFERHLQDLGVDLRLDCEAQAIARHAEHWQVRTVHGPLLADALVLALDAPGLQRLLDESGSLAAAVRVPLARLRPTRPFAVWRLWLDRPVDAGRTPFAGTAGYDLLDNVSVYSAFHDESVDWAHRHQGAVLELHAYGLTIDDEADIRRRLLEALHAVYPETAAARLLGEQFLLRADCPAFPPGSAAGRPGVATAEPTLVLAGDHVRLPFACALMERATASGVLAANMLLAMRQVDPAPLWSGPRRGLLAPALRMA